MIKNSNIKKTITDQFSFFSWKKGEILWVGVVIGVILFISWRQLITGEQKTRDAQRKADVELVARALERYYDDYQIYPAASSSGQIISCGYLGAEVCRWGEDKIIDEDEVVYLKKLPLDPQNWKGVQYTYTTDETRKKFRILVHLEYAKDPAYKKSLTGVCGKDVQCNWYVENK